MKTLILSCNTGEGHNSCAKAIKEYYDKVGEACDIADAMGFVSNGVSTFMSKGHVFVYRHMPWCFRYGYAFSEKHPGVFQESSAIFQLLVMGRKRMYDYIQQEKYDVVICTHVFASLMLTDLLKKNPLQVVSGLVATDYTCCPSTKDCEMDYYFIPAKELAPDFESSFITAEKIVPAGIPVRQMFFQAMAKDEAKRQWDISTGHKHLLIMCGSMGCGPIKKLAGSLSEKLKPECDITIVCGTNHKLQEKLEEDFSGISNIHICGYVKDMSSLLDSADLCLTKPGGLSVTEAALKRVPMVFVDAVAGCEEYNRAFFVRIGGAQSLAEVDELAEKCISLLENDNSRRNMEMCLELMPYNNAAEIIHETMKREWKKRYGKDKQQEENVQNAGTST